MRFEKSKTLCLLSGLFLVSIPHAIQVFGSEGPVQHPGLRVTLELAPGAIGAMVTDDLLYLANGDGRTTLCLFNNATGALTTYLETGDEWGSRWVLRDEHGWPFSAGGVHVAVADRLSGATSSRHTYLFDDDGSTLCSTRALNSSFDIVAARANEWVVSLQPMALVDGEERKGPSPRVVVLNDDCEVVEQGLEVSDSDTCSMSIAAGRALHLAANKRRVFAVEYANYRIYELDRRLNLLSVLHDPELILEGGAPGQEGDDSVRTARLEHLQQELKALEEMFAASRDLARPEGSDADQKQAPIVEAFSWVPVVKDIVWDPVDSRLLLLISTEVAAGNGALDIIQLETGTRERYLLTVPADLPQPIAEFGQVAVTRHFIWFSSASGSSPTFRVHRMQLVGGAQLALSNEHADGGVKR